MPARGRELHDVRAALRRLLERYPAKTRRSLEPDLQKVLHLGAELSKLTEPVGRGDDGEPSPGERSVSNAWQHAASALADDTLTAINSDRSPGSRAGTGTPGQQAAARAADAYELGEVGTHKGKTRGARHVTTLRDIA